MKKLYCFLVTLLVMNVYAQEATIDHTFNILDNETNSEFIGYAPALQPDGKILTFMPTGNGIDGKIIRLDYNGNLDDTFNFNSTITYLGKIFVKSDGKFLVPHQIPQVDNQISIRSFNADGTENNSFISPQFIYDNISNSHEIRLQDIIYQSDGKIIIVGTFNRVNNQVHNHIVRLNENGTIDDTFNSGTGFSIQSPWITINCIAQQNDGKYIVGGDFTAYNGVSKVRMVRLNSDGSVDNSFHVNTTGTWDYPTNGLDGDLRDLIIQPDGKILACTRFRSNGAVVARLVTRLNSTGNRDTSFGFNGITSFDDISESIILLSNGKILTSQILASSTKIMKRNSNGSLDSSFSYSNLFASPPNCYLLLQGNKIIVSYSYKNANGNTRMNIHRINENGSIDLTFNPNVGPNKGFIENRSKLNPKVLQDGKILLTGTFSSYNENPCRGICRLNYNGDFDTSFSLDQNVTLTSGAYSYENLYHPDYEIETKTRQLTNGKLILLGRPTESGLNPLKRMIIKVNGVIKNLIQLNENGTLDNSFNFSPNTGNNVTDYEVQEDGKILIIGTGNLFMENSNYKVIRLNLDGSIDNTFVSPLFISPLSNICVQADNKILVKGKYITNFFSIYRLNANGSLDNSFSYNQDVEYLNYMKPLSNGKIIISYRPYSNNPTYIKRLLENGSNDTTFNVSSPGTDNIFELSNGNLVSSFYSISSISSINNKYLIYNDSGSVINSFVSKTIPTQIAQQNCNDFIVAGNFYNIDGFLKNHIVRYTLSDEANPITPPPSGSMNQSFFVGQTLNELNIIGENILWYTEQNACVSNLSNRQSNEILSQLPNSTLLVDGNTYYASQTNSGNESFHRLPVTVNQTLSVFENNSLGFNVYPNPFINELTISNSKIIDKIEVYTITGQIIYEKKCDSETELIKLNSLRGGVYILKIYSDDKIKTLRIIKNQ